MEHCRVRALRISAVILLCVGTALGFYRRPDASLVRTWVSPVMEINKTYASMSGPQQVEFFTLDAQSHEIGWITGFGAQTVNADTQAADGQRFLCHTNLILPAPQLHVQPMEGGDIHPRLFTVSQGQTAFQLPEGFGIPIRFDTPLMFEGQVLNEQTLDKPARVRQVADLTYVRQSDLSSPLKPLLCRMVGVVREIADYHGEKGQVSLAEGDGCGMVSDLTPAIRIRYGKYMTGHWTVPPGRKVYRSEVTRRLDLPYDTTVHMATLHVHPYCESVELRDMTTARSVLSLRVHRTADGTRISKVEDFHDPVGIPLVKGHRYEVISVYNNDSDEDQDAMVNLFLFLADKSFDPLTES